MIKVATSDDRLRFLEKKLSGKIAFTKLPGVSTGSEFDSSKIFKFFLDLGPN